MKRRAQPEPETPLTGREAAVLLREWLDERYPPELAQSVMDQIPWKDNPEPMGSRKALWWWFFFNIAVPVDISRNYPRELL